jgi:hypothetical protein
MSRPSNRTLAATVAGILAALVVAGCCDIKIPSISVGQLINPEWAKHEVTADVCYRFPKCTFDSDDQKKQFEEAKKSINDAGAMLRPMLKKGDISAEEFVMYELINEFYAAQLLAWCESTQPPLVDPGKALVLSAADRAGVRADVDRVLSTPRPARLGVIASGAATARSKVQAKQK